MLGKLFRYEMKACGRILLPLYGALLVLALINGLTIDANLGFVNGLMIFIFICLVMATFIVTLILIIQRFWTNLLKDEGYLMFTLPANTYQIVGAKALSSLCWVILGAVAGCAAAFLWIFAFNPSWTGEFLQELSYFLRDFIQNAAREGVNGYAFLLLSGLTTFLGMGQQILLLYTAMSFSQMVNRYRVLAAGGSFLLINYLQNRFSALAGNLLLGQKTLTIPSAFSGIFGANIPNTGFPSGLSDFYASLQFSAVSAVVFAALFFWLSCWLLNNKLNLE